MITIGIIDKNQESRERLVSILEDAAPDPIIGEKPDLFVNFARESFHPESIHPDECHPDVVLIDLEGQSVDSIRKIKATYPETNVIVVSNSIKTTDALKAYREGAVDYIQKSTAGHFIYFAILSTITATGNSSGRRPHRVRLGK